jgi:hypothetical protein
MARSTGSPLVSVCLPTFNSGQFLPERLATIFDQSLDDWELIGLDSYSDDGTYEMLEAAASRDRRVRVNQAPRDGIYPNFNRCIRESSGRYVYIATSDDTMAPDCLEKLVISLETNADCDLAHCPLRIIDEHGRSGIDWWSGHSAFARCSGEWCHIPHKRLAPHDGVVCMLGDNVYSSVTQLLIRRSLFSRIGTYPTNWGSVGDFHWNMRAGLAANTVHVPDTWGGWRMHSSQATAGAQLGSAEHDSKIDGMTADVLRIAGTILDPDVHRHLLDKLAPHAVVLKEFLRDFGRLQGSQQRKLFLLRQAIGGSGPAWHYLASLLGGKRRWPRGAWEGIRDWPGSGGLVKLDGAR